jgi:acyl-coenzyme A thioesterase PaaI-like protein
MRPGLPADTYACGEVVRVGGRIANVSVSAWQDDPDRIIAVARMNLAITPPDNHEA